MMKNVVFESTMAIFCRAVMSVVLVVWVLMASAGLDATKSIKSGLTTVSSKPSFSCRLQDRPARTTADFYCATLAKCRGRVSLDPNVMHIVSAKKSQTAGQFDGGLA